ncbi:LysM domain protein [Candidatus Desulfosporosinus infrequens]|uniref:LysM domain protein n=1 Tax=Candidatus Desulfosporosinus infrequens TaxID=2043169 RepID=A0A2U3KCR0_9FIRM|nr:LysM domain protein [Candidatus Desulfosporosinus infrequens]
MMCLFLWQVSIYPVLGQGGNNEAVLSNNIAKEETKEVNNVNDNELENSKTGILSIAVQHGETLWGLAKKYDTTVEKIVKCNHLQSPNQIKEGEALWVQKRETEQATEDLAINTVKASWWVNILRSIPAFTAVNKQALSISRSSDSRSLPPEPKIPTYDIIVNEDIQLIDKDDAQKLVEQNPVPSETESQVLAQGLGCLVSKDDLDLLSRVIYGEARGENFEGQVAVGAVVLNRLKDPRFPKTMRAVIYQSGAFTAVDDKQIQLDPNDQSYKAAEAALSGMDPTNGALFYFNPRLATDNWIKSRSVIKRIGNHTFSI